MSGDCILCGKCLEVCPLLRATGREELGPRAKADLCFLLGDDETLLSGEDVAKLAGLCLGCHRCKAVCSQGVDVPGLVAALRLAHPDFKGWLWKTWLTHARELWSSTSLAAKLIPKNFQSEKFGPFLKMLAGLKGGPGLEPFLIPEIFPDTYRGERMLLFAGCTANYVQGRWLVTALRLLDGLGIEVLPGDFKCCGGGLSSAGFDVESEAMACKNIDVWRKAGKPKMVLFCASCLSSLGGYENYFEDSEEFISWQRSLMPLSALLREATFVVSEKASGKVAYHRPCHVDKADSDYMFLHNALGNRLIVSTSRECCGFGGVMRLGTPALADAVNRDCWEKLGTPDVVLTGCSACAAQLAATAPNEVRVGHWLEIIA
ncbi:MAG: (Fe-S)-binding protein [Pseudodesulfovibrio sp.]|nr:(Fe-S)-binding protein [Pseudodesulfovibrio sp.]